MNALNHSLAGQAAMITGGRRGIGMAIALAFAQAVESARLPGTFQVSSVK